MNATLRSTAQQHPRITDDDGYVSTTSSRCLRTFKILTKRTLFLLGGLILSALSQANTAQRNDIQQTIESEVRSAFKTVPTKDINTIVTLPAVISDLDSCHSTLNYQWRGAPEAGQNTLKVSCADPLWQSYVSVEIEIYKNVVVSAEPLSRNNPIESNQLRIKRMNIAQLRMGYFEDPKELDGYLVQRTLKADQVITPYIAKAPPLIMRGDWVTILSGKSGLTVTSTGEALKDGVMGEQIPVKNLASKTTVRAWVVSHDQVSTQKK